MNFYPILLTLHVLGALTMLVLVVLDAVTLRRLGRLERAEGATSVTTLLGVPQRVGPVAAAAILISGVTMMAIRWGFQGWIIVGVAGLVAMAILGAIGGIRLRRLVDQLPSLGEPGLEAVRAPGFVALLATRAGLLIGIIVIMNAKPDALGSLLTVAGAGLIGLAVGAASLALGRARQIMARGA